MPALVSISNKSMTGNLTQLRGLPDVDLELCWEVRFGPESLSIWKTLGGDGDVLLMSKKG